MYETLTIYIRSPMSISDLSGSFASLLMWTKPGYSTDIWPKHEHPKGSIKSIVAAIMSESNSNTEFVPSLPNCLYLCNKLHATCIEAFRVLTRTITSNETWADRFLLLEVPKWRLSIGFIRGTTLHSIILKRSLLHVYHGSHNE